MRNLRVCLCLLLSIFFAGCNMFLSEEHRQGKMYMEKREYTKALECFLQAYEKDSTNVELLCDMGAVYIDLYDAEKSLLYLNKALDHAKESEAAGVYARRAQAYNILGLLNESIRDCDIALSYDDKETGVYLSRGIAYDKAGMVDKAIADFDKVIELDPNELRGYAHKGLAYHHDGQFEKALSLYDYVLQRNPNYDLVYNWKGIALRKMQKYPEAIACFNKLIALSPQMIEPRVLIALTYIDMGEKDKGCEGLRQSMKYVVTKQHQEVIIGYMQEMCGDSTSVTP